MKIRMVKSIALRSQSNWRGLLPIHGNARNLASRVVSCWGRGAVKRVFGFLAFLNLFNIVANFQNAISFTASLKWIAEWWHYAVSVIFSFIPIALSRNEKDVISIFICISMISFRSHFSSYLREGAGALAAASAMGELTRGVVAGFLRFDRAAITQAIKSSVSPMLSERYAAPGSNGGILSTVMLVFPLFMYVRIVDRTFIEWFGSDGGKIALIYLLSPLAILPITLALGIMLAKEDEDLNYYTAFSFVLYVPAIVMTYICFECAKYIESEIWAVAKYLALFCLILIGSALASAYIDPQMEELLVNLPRPPRLDA